MNLEAHSRNLRLNRLKEEPATFFITKCLFPKKPIIDRQAAEVIVSALAFAVQKQRIYLRAFVVMPDHWHALFALREPWTLPKFMHDFMSYVGGRTAKLLSHYKTSWQDTYYDTFVKTAKQFEYVAEYIELNPVTKGLVERPEQWGEVAQTGGISLLNLGLICMTKDKAVGALRPLPHYSCRALS